MNLQKITKIIVAVIGVIAFFFLVRILMLGDDAIANDVTNQGVVSSFITLGYVVFAITAAVTILFSLINLITHPNKLKEALVSVVIFGVIIAIAYFMSTGKETDLGDGNTLSEFGSKWVETGIRAFYFLVVIAIGTMIWGGVKKVLSR